MAAALWNYVNIPFPSAISIVRVPFTSETDKNIKALMVEMGRVQRLICSEMLQTEVRVLYELLYFLNNSFRGNKAFNCVKQVEQCINRLKDMKLDVALVDLSDACPQNIQRKLGLKTGECDVPSQPTLEWVCLKVLGASRLSTCTLTRCSKAFVLVRRQMKWSEFLVLNMVITSMLSRLWVIFRGLLLYLSTLYQQLLVVVRAVAQSRPMPFLTDFSLPKDLVEFLGPSEAHFLINHPTFIKNLKRKKFPAEVEIKRKKKRKEEDLGVAIKRDVGFDFNLKPIFSISKNLTQGKSVPEEMHKVEIQKFQKQAMKAASFTHMSTHLEEMIQWCRSQRMKKEEQLLSFLHLKCKRMKKSLEDTKLSDKKPTLENPYSDSQRQVKVVSAQKTSQRQTSDKETERS
ncbi:nucleolus and neural progenitor protein-like isoform X2 [Gouania willdenowi]|uniref:nucleolus and neural progenitor protein-like isoform X2 n=1 Tax=Gouania willdenowi TaxID=441366 RepID=UPI001054A40C|nr:nucleolus and neural progenitor protein-like isoform X2 [Gouania willdenowi]